MSIDASDFQRVAALVEQGYTPDEALAKIQTPTPAPAKKKANTEPKAKKELHRFLEERTEVIPEYQFDPARKWRADYYLPEHTIIVEYDGLMRHGENHGHASIGGILADVEKYNAASLMGIRVFRANAKNVSDRSFFRLMDMVLDETGDDT